MAKVLLVERSQQEADPLKHKLQVANYNVTVSTNGGDQAILFAVTSSPDIILVNTDLPVISGWQVIKILKTSEVTQKIPVIALVDPTFVASGHMILESGWDAYEMKPFAIQSLLDKMESCLNPHLNLEKPLAQTSPQSKIPTPQALPVSSFQGLQNNQKPLTTTTVKRQPRKPVIIYVDDNPKDSTVMAAIIQGLGLDYISVSDPLQTIPILLEVKPNLIFVDLVMPIVNGYELCAQIRRVSAFRATPIVIVTNHDGITDRVRAKLVGASGFLGKPIKQQRVLAVLMRFLQFTPNEQSHNEQSHTAPQYNRVLSWNSQDSPST